MVSVVVTYTQFFYQHHQVALYESQMAYHRFLVICLCNFTDNMDKWEVCFMVLMGNLDWELCVRDVSKCLARVSSDMSLSFKHLFTKLYMQYMVKLHKQITVQLRLISALFITNVCVCDRAANHYTRARYGYFITTYHYTSVYWSHHSVDN